MVKWLGSYLLSIFALPALVVAQDEFAQTGDPRNPVFGRVGSSAITLGDVCFQLGIDPIQATGESGLAAGLRDRTVHLIGLQKQTRQSLLRLGIAPSSEEVERYLTEQRLEPNPPFVTRESLNELVEFRLAWRAYLLKHVNDQNLQRHFESQRARFDGTRFEIELVSLPVPPGQSPIRTAALQRLKALFKDVLGEAAFKTATESLKEGAEVAQIEVRGTGDVDPVVISQLLKLRPGGVSEPFSSAVAVHVVRLADVQPGSLALEEVAGEVRGHMLVYLLEHLASQSAGQLPFVSTLENKTP